MGVEDEYRYQMEMSWERSDEQVNHMIFKSRKVSKEENGRHSRLNHDFWVGRLGQCPYCREGGRIIDEEVKEPVL